jgi:aminopeptidase N
MTSKLSIVAFVITGLGLALPVLGGAPYSFESVPGRLPKNVVPLDYVIEIVPNAADLTLTGRESVALQFRASSATIIFNSLNEILSDVRLDGRPVKSVVSSDEQQLTTVTLAKPAATGPHTLAFAYTAKIERQPRGLFAQSYVNHDGTKGLMLTTQMEPTEARRMFPCWDEPAFRATFQLAATMRSDWATVGNMPIANRVAHGNLATTTFERTPKMPSYLVEYTAGDLAAVNADSGGTRFSVWATRGQEHDGEIALANAPKILADYNAYFGYPYPLPKLDSIAIPGGFDGAMENWGAITYNDQTLLVTPSSTLSSQQNVFSYQAHEMAHQWNGDLVTMGWWDDIWLNESFASWMAAKETALRNPDWKWWEGQDAYKETAMDADASNASHAIEQHVSNELQANSSFDPDITYRKGQAILRMFEAYLGPDIFRDGVRAYMNAHAYSNATSADLWHALNSVSRENIGKIASGWTEQPGYPLVMVAASCDASGARTIKISQRRFVLRGTDPRVSHWNVPLQIRSGAGGAPQSVLATTDNQTVLAGRCDEPLSVNAGAIGFYRTQYDQATLRTDTANFGSLPDPDRIALLDDQWALAQSGAGTLPSYLALASAMGTDLDTRAWDQITGALGTIEYDERGAAGHNAFATYARSVIKPVADQLRWDAKPGETPDVQRLRRTLIGNLGAWGDQSVIGEARRRFNGFMADRGSLSPDDQTVVLSIVAQYADVGTFARLHALAKTAGNEAQLDRYYSALMAVRDPALAVQAANIALSPEIPPQADSQRLRFIGRLAQFNPNLAWQVFRDNSEQLLAPYVMQRSLIITQRVPQLFWDAVALPGLENWIRAHVPAQLSVLTDRGLERAQFELHQKQALVTAADAYLRRAVNLGHRFDARSAANQRVSTSTGVQP